MDATFPAYKLQESSSLFFVLFTFPFSKEHQMRQIDVGTGDELQDADKPLPNCDVGR